LDAAVLPGMDVRNLATDLLRDFVPFRFSQEKKRSMLVLIEALLHLNEPSVSRHVLQLLEANHKLLVHLHIRQS
jgi:hypothetical protein